MNNPSIDKVFYDALPVSVFPSGSLAQPWASLAGVVV